MSTQTIPQKTPEGVAELSSRERKLSQRHRTVLLLVDGRRHEAMVRQMAVQAGAAETCFDELVALGLIALPALSTPVTPTALAEPEPASPNAVTAAPEAVTSADASPAAAEPTAEPPETTATPAPSPVASDATAPDSIVSLLPPAQTLQPESSLMGDSVLGSVTPSGLTPFTELEDILEEARGILLRAVRAEAPVTGSLTLLRLRRARSRDDLEALLDEVEARITKPNKGLWAAQTMERARELLHAHAVQSMPMPLA